VRKQVIPPFCRWLLAAALLIGVPLLLNGCGTNETGGVHAPTDAGSEAGAGIEGGRPEGGSAITLPRRLLVGAHCRSDDDCGAPFTCLTSASDVIATAHGPGGPSNGLCSAHCDSGREACAAAENPTECVELTPGKHYCLPSCTPGGQGGAVGDKCLGRLDLACAPPQKDGQTGFCAPTCGGDFECGGRTCDLGSGACVDRVPPGVRVGGDCESEACGNGTCESLGFFQACTGFCTVGTVGCGFDPLSKDRLDSFCLLAATTAGSSADVGLCAQLCDCNDDCRHPRFVCSEGPPGNPASLSVRGHRGACLPPSLTQPGKERGIPCGQEPGPSDGGADAHTDASGFPRSAP
jgi:hypothetical protein